jgi:hypothetical protein
MEERKDGGERERGGCEMEKEDPRVSVTEAFKAADQTITEP